MFLLRKRKMILNFGKMLDIIPKFDIITVAFQRQQVGRPCKSCRGWQNHFDDAFLSSCLSA